MRPTTYEDKIQSLLVSVDFINYTLHVTALELVCQCSGQWSFDKGPLEIYLISLLIPFPHTQASHGSCLTLYVTYGLQYIHI